MTLVINPLTSRFAALLLLTMIITTASQITFAQGLPRNFAVHDVPRAVAEISFEDNQGRERSLADFKGRVVVLNIWATWCASCRYEMPALDALQASLGGSDFEVVPLSIDRSGIDAMAKFYTENGVRSLATYIDTSGKALRELGALGLPTTLIIDRTGQEIARIVGPAEWDAPEVVMLLKSVIAMPSAPTAIAQADPARAQNDPEWSRSFMRGVRWLRETFTK